MRISATVFYVFLWLVSPVSLMGSSYHLLGTENSFCLYTKNKIASGSKCAMCEPPRINVISSIMSNRFWAKWESIPFALFYEYELGSPGFVPNSGQAMAAGAVMDNFTIVDQLEPGTAYEIVLRTHCPTDISEYPEPLLFTSSPLCGGPFYDIGGPNGGLPRQYGGGADALPRSARRRSKPTF